MTPPPANDETLHELLQTWQVEPRHDPALAHRIWARLADEKPPRATAWIESLSHWLARPMAAALAIALFAGLGVLAGEWRNAGQREAVVTRLASEYAQSIDPVLMTFSGDHAGHAP